MTFVWPIALLALLLVPVLVACYVVLARRRAQRQAELGTMGELRTRTGKPAGRRRHVPATIFLGGITLLIVGIARPETTLHLPRREGTVILAFDVSSSMEAKDIKPSRVKAAQDAARAFVRNQPGSIRVGVVAFSNTGFVLQKPTRSKQDVLSAIGRLTPGGGTSLGDAIITSLRAIAGKPLTLDAEALQNGAPQPSLPFLGSSVVILLSDGENTAQLDPVSAADVAAQAGVRIDPIGLGSANGAVVNVDGFSVTTNLDETLLRRIARTSNGTYYHATEASKLTNVYDNIDLKLTVQGKKTEITSLFAAGALVLFLIAAGLSIRWFGRVV